MVRFLLGAVLGLLAAVLLVERFRAPPPPERPPPAPLYLDTVRDVLSLEVLEVQMHRRVGFEPDPKPDQKLGAQLLAWAKESLAPEKGEAVVFATARYFVDVSRLRESALRLEGRTAEFEMPRVSVVVELLPEETILLRSTLGPGGETQLLARAKLLFEDAARSNPRLMDRARANAERAARELFLRSGYDEVKITLEPPR